MECIDNAEAPDGWTKWIIPSYEYIVVENHKGAFEETIRQMNEHGISLVGAVHDYTEPTTGNDIVNIGLHFILKNVRPYAASCSEA